MYLTYLDESGSTGRRLDDPDQPVHWLVGVLVPEANVVPLAHALDNVVKNYVPDDPRRELHGSELFGGDKSWKGVTPSIRIGVYRDSLAALKEHNCVISYASINKQKLQSLAINASPYLLALHFLIEKIDDLVHQNSNPLLQRALLVADQTHENEAHSIDLLFALQRDGSGVFPGKQITNIIDTVHFVPSETNRGVQAADLVAFALRRLGNGGWSSEKPSDIALAEMVRDYVLPLVATYHEEWPS